MVKTDGKSLGDGQDNEFLRILNNDGTLSFYSRVNENEEAIETNAKCSKFRQKQTNETGVFTLISDCNNKPVAVDGKFTEFLFSNQNILNFVPMTELSTLEELVTIQ